ncbi:MAG: hypothetical protein MK132_00620 [Lentisphaerales bacterium]|nr:hypothetical protein [Lentisphaerales bacterium]
MDFFAHASVYSEKFTPAAINIIKGESGLDATLSFETTQSKLVLTVFLKI